MLNLYSYNALFTCTGRFFIFVFTFLSSVNNFDFSLRLQFKSNILVNYIRYHHDQNLTHSNGSTGVIMWHLTWKMGRIQITVTSIHAI